MLACGFNFPAFGLNLLSFESFSLLLDTVAFFVCFFVSFFALPLMESDFSGAFVEITHKSLAAGRIGTVAKLITNRH